MEEGGFFGSGQTKYNSESYKEGSRGDEGSPTISLSLSPPSPFPLPSPISLKMEEKEEEEKCTLLKHEWITKSRVHSFAPYRPRNPQKVYLSPRATMAYTLARRRPTFLPSLLTPRPRGIVIGVLLNRYV